MKLVLVLFTLLLLTACSMNPPASQNPEFAPVYPVVAAAPPAQNGSLYSQGYGISLFSDVSAKRIGDIITVILQENTNASKSTSTSTQKESSADLPTPTILGDLLKLNGKEINASIASEREFSGSGDSSQSNSLNGSISVTVIDVLANGYLRVQGEKRLTLNQGSEHIQFSGIVRPADIRSDNSVLSANVGNAAIIYGGSGALADASAPGWLSRVVASPWWPF
ncbi:MAG: flagellar basal body L-ring protein FlgH [Gammaproteobacteria bacterium]|nr:flagellar basal body L-ring protein FlgH [Gammaproteobacteria bacterium]MDH5728284.1 flagellar basal body L-ring protein FlgH [Gammaproteobacteria bacterium]